ncbi:MAG: 4-(cytidine 5'-diphospho)-2-C-methyl-D-erythritol kinase [Candidatus Omnitrophota bacterium]
MNSITVKAPAKVNLFLKVLGKRKDSYHNILTLFERISLADTIKISKIPKGIVVKSDMLITPDARDNLCFKAAEAVLKRGKVVSGVKIEIKKRIPIASGLGGGSSDAASTIMGINRLFKLRLNSKTLLDIGRKLGADVPFFLLDTQFAIGRGRGDMLEVVKSKAKFWHLIVKAGYKTATKDIYGSFDRASKRLILRHGSGSSAELLPKHLTPRSGSAKIHPLLELRMDYAEAESILHNDLERAVSLKKGVTGRIFKSLAQLLGKKIIISGSGPSLFCLYRTRREAIEARDAVLKSMNALSRTNWQIFVA